MQDQKIPLGLGFGLLWAHLQKPFELSYLISAFVNYALVTHTKILTFWKKIFFLLKGQI